MKRPCESPSPFVDLGLNISVICELIKPNSAEYRPLIAQSSASDDAFGQVSIGAIVIRHSNVGIIIRLISQVNYEEPSTSYDHRLSYDSSC